MDADWKPGKPYGESAMFGITAIYDGDTIFT
jgi:hypothetical protein